VAEGANVVMVGDPTATTVQSCARVARFPATVTVILPVAAALGTVTASVLAVAAVTVAAAPLNRTAFAPGVAANPLPVIETLVPGVPKAGANAPMAIGDGLTRWMTTMLPA